MQKNTEAFEILEKETEGLGIEAWGAEVGRAIFPSSEEASFSLMKLTG